MQFEALLAQCKAGGITCPACGCRDFRVTNTWLGEGSRKRLRRCRNCGEPVTTLEVPVKDGFEIKSVPKEKNDL
jgi:transcriptional regulator NrdR family protein